MLKLLEATHLSQLEMTAVSQDIAEEVSTQSRAIPLDRIPDTHPDIINAENLDWPEDLELIMRHEEDSQTCSSIDGSHNECDPVDVTKDKSVDLSSQTA